MPADKAYNESYYQRNKARLQEAGRKNYLRRREAILQDRKENWVKYKSIELKSNFGITYSDYLRLLNKQNGVCAICQMPEQTVSRAGVRKRLAVDHNHETGKIRGLLCSGCNQAIGLLHDDPSRAAALVAYLRERNG